MEEIVHIAKNISGSFSYLVANLLFCFALLNVHSTVPRFLYDSLSKYLFIFCLLFFGITHPIPFFFNRLRISLEL